MRLAACVLVLGGTVSLVAQGPTFTTRVRTVRVDVSVRQNGEPVRGLGAADFEVLDNGVRQAVDYVGQDGTPISVVLALDMSGSVQGERLSQLRAAGTVLASKLES